MRLWTYQAPNFSLTNGVYEPKESRNYLNYSDAYHELWNRVETNGLIWCCNSRDGWRRKGGYWEWELDVPESEIFRVVDEGVWGKIRVGKIAKSRHLWDSVFLNDPTSSNVSVLLKFPLEASWGKPVRDYQNLGRHEFIQSLINGFWEGFSDKAAQTPPKIQAAWNAYTRTDMLPTAWRKMRGVYLLLDELDGCFRVLRIGVTGTTFAERLKKYNFPRTGKDVQYHSQEHGWQHWFDYRWVDIIPLSSEVYPSFIAKALETFLLTKLFPRHNTQEVPVELQNAPVLMFPS